MTIIFPDSSSNVPGGGSPGPGPTPVVSDLHYTHLQSVASDAWEIEHNLGKKPSITVVDSADTVIKPNEVIYNSNNKLTIYFLAKFAGKAYLN